MARCLSVPDPTTGADRTWGRVLGSIKQAVDKRWPNSRDRLTGDGNTFSTLHGSLAAIQNPYRDASMHLEQRYSEEEATHIFEMAKGLMTKIAERMDENGDPKVSP